VEIGASDAEGWSARVFAGCWKGDFPGKWREEGKW